MKKTIKIKVTNGLWFDYMIDAIFKVNDLCNDYYFVNDDQDPDVIIFGPYGNEIPQKGDYLRVGYYCENIIPDLDICDWAFGIPAEQYVNSPKYKRIQWQGINPQELIKPADYDPEQILASKRKFCNFLYTAHIPYREEFFKQLSKYKKIDAPGKSMNNMSSVETMYKGDLWAVKKQFLPQYKFTIAFENYVYPGYQTEKLYDAMVSESLPIYCGDPDIGQIFNTRSFLNAADLLEINNSLWVKFIEHASQWNFNDIRPQFFNSPASNLQRKIKSIGREYKMKLQFNKLDFSNLIDQIILLDKDPELYMNYLKEPWFNNNTPPPNASLKQRWVEIFSAVN